MKRSKKRWSWTKKNLRKSRSVGYHYNYSNAPKSFRIYYVKKDRLYDNFQLFKEVKTGVDAIYKFGRTYKRTAGWAYW